MILTPNEAGIWIIYGAKNVGTSTLIKQMIDEIANEDENTIKPTLYVPFEAGVGSICNVLNVFPARTDRCFPAPTSKIDQFEDA